MPHVFKIDCGLVLGLTLLLKIDRGEHVHSLVHASLEQNVASLEVLVAFFDLFHGV